MHAHFDCFSGISGDMVLGAFVDLGVSTQWLAEQIAGLPLGEVAITARQVKRHGIGAVQVSVDDKTSPRPRHYDDIVALIDRSGLADRVKQQATAIFDRIADAEAHVHRCAKAAVHFHEVGAVDSIVDIVGAALCLDRLGIESVSASPLPMGRGWVTCAHGQLPVPAPAVPEILKGIPVVGGPGDGEWVTPTGAAIVAALARTFGDLPAMTIERIGYGSGTRDRTDVPNLLRVYVGERRDAHADLSIDAIDCIEANIDDMNPEIYGYLMERLFADGALDVGYLPMTMKKNRPGIKIEVICPPDRREAIVDRLLTETSTIGVRFQRLDRRVLPRSPATVRTRFGPVRVKCIVDPGGDERVVPEYESCRELALRSGHPLQRIYHAVAEAARNAADRESP